MARELFRLGSSDPPTSEPDPGEDLICIGGAWGGGSCGLPKQWVVMRCHHDNRCPGYWAWRCPTGRHAEPDDVLDSGAHSMSHERAEREARVASLHACPECGARDWRMSGRYTPDDPYTSRFVCEVCGHGIPVPNSGLRGGAVRPELLHDFQKYLDATQAT